MMKIHETNQRRQYSWWATVPMLLLLILPLAALLVSSSPSDIFQHLQSPFFLQAFWLSLKTSLVSLLLVIVLGLPLAWLLGTAPPRHTRFLTPIIDLPIVLPPAVLGVALLVAFSPEGFLGATLALVGLHIPFSSVAVVIAQVVVSAPFFIQSASAAFKGVDPDLVLVARTLGRTPWETFWQVTVPLSLPGIMSGATLAWARALGEFGATLIFAGNFPGSTQTLPLAIYMALESDVRIALTLSVLLALIALLLLSCLRLIPLIWHRQTVPTGSLSATYDDRSQS